MNDMTKHYRKRSIGALLVSLTFVAMFIWMTPLASANYSQTWAPSQMSPQQGYSGSTTQGGAYSYYIHSLVVGSECCFGVYARGGVWQSGTATTFCLAGYAVLWTVPSGQTGAYRFTISYWINYFQRSTVNSATADFDTIFDIIYNSNGQSYYGENLLATLSDTTSGYYHTDSYVAYLTAGQTYNIWAWVSGHTTAGEDATAQIIADYSLLSLTAVKQ